MANNMQWYCVKTVNTRERSLIERIQHETKTGNTLCGKVGEIILPMEKYQSSDKSGKKVVKEKVLMPGYIFLETNSIPDLKYFLRGIGSTTGFVTDRSGQPEPIPHDSIMRMIGKKEDVKAEAIFNINDTVKIINGAFVDMKGTVTKIDSDSVHVNLSIFGRLVETEVPFTNVVKI